MIKARRFYKRESLLGIQLHAGSFLPSIEISVFVVPNVREWWNGSLVLVNLKVKNKMDSEVMNGNSQSLIINFVLSILHYWHAVGPNHS